MKKGTIEFIPKEGCSGCSACQSVCPVDAINMLSDIQGFKYPSIDQEKCINCSLCLNTCPYQNEFRNPVEKTYATKHSDVDDQLSSTSGGFASALSEFIISQGGSVYGVVENRDFSVTTVRAIDKEEIQRFKGSKYVQTDLLETFREVVSDLKEKRRVVFFGTSCHIDGLYHFLSKKKIDNENLMTVDFLCHGVPSPKLFREYCEYAGRKHTLTEYLFRTKSKGWGFGTKTYAPTLVYKKNEATIIKSDTSLARAWMQLFFSNNCLRPHCYECPYAGKGRPADITMADYWGLHKEHPEFFDKNGVSLVFCNTEKGSEVFNSIPNLISIESEKEKAQREQSNMIGASKKSIRYGKFWDDYQKKGFPYILHRYTNYNLKARLKRKIKNLIGR